MRRTYRPAALAVTAILLANPSAHAMMDDEFVRAYGNAPMQLRLCGDGDEQVKQAVCKEAGFDKMVKRIEAALAAALARAPANIRPLLKRDQTWFNEMTTLGGASLVEFDDGSDKLGELLRRRAAVLDSMNFAHTGVAGKWSNAFGSVTVTADGDSYRVAFDLSALYGAGEERRRECRATGIVKQDNGAWLSGALLPDEAARPADAKAAPKTPPTVKIRRQGATLRIVVAGEDYNDEYNDEDRPSCQYLWQATASYFADGKTDAAAPPGAIDSAFVAPNFDCTRPGKASEEEICADPDLAENDQKLNRAWKALLPRLDDGTRRTLTEDQRSWVGSQSNQYPQFLHPAWEKRSSEMHFTTDARDRLDRLQKERIALIEGFDDKRSGFAGLWLAYNAVLKVTATEDGGIKAQGWKWDQGDWKGGCEFDMTGKVIGARFVADEKRKNPDTLERDRGSLIVNRLDDVFAPKRTGKDDDEPKCRRNYSFSSTVRLFPAKASPDIDNLGGSSIR